MSEHRLLQVHAHWGGGDGRGSEHSLDGVFYDAELHLVHYNTEYGDPGAALDKLDGLVVVAVFIKVLGRQPQGRQLFFLTALVCF